MSENQAALPAKSPDNSRSTLSHIMMVTDTNLFGTVHGGVIMKLVDECGGMAAARHSGGTAVTASMDEMAFLAPVRVGDLVHATAQVNWVGRSSLEVEVDVTAERWDQSAAHATHVASAHLVFVAIDGTGQPRTVPPLELETDEHRRRWAEAQIRRTHRLARRDAILASRSAAER
jgi:uncharacterized protein (TIGR00369 family)